ncbi:MAG: hypothetical protein E6R04_06860 [Spirochaetes bacterium]|nr:MAG: hypothetical protein E6R04_06860 [Spirochaetota bacterium]
MDGIPLTDIVLDPPSAHAKRVRPGPVMRDGLRAAGVPAHLLRDFVEVTYDIIEHASGWDHGAVTPPTEHGPSLDSDGAHPDARRGLTQLHPGEFARYHAAGTSPDIYDPVASIAALWRLIADQFDVDLTTGAVLQMFTDLVHAHPETWRNRASNPLPDVISAEIL